MATDSDNMIPFQHCHWQIKKSFDKPFTLYLMVNSLMKGSFTLGMVLMLLPFGMPLRVGLF
jgi:hypothetical protein